MINSKLSHYKTPYIVIKIKELVNEQLKKSSRSSSKWFRNNCMKVSITAKLHFDVRKKSDC